MHEKQARSDRFQTWTLESRIRFALVQPAISAGLVLGLIALIDGPDTLRQGLWFTVLVAGMAFALNGWVRYPRAKARTNDPTRSS